MRLPPEVVAARQATLGESSPADLRRASELRGQERNSSVQIGGVPLSGMGNRQTRGPSPIQIEKLRLDDVDDSRAIAAARTQHAVWVGQGRPLSGPAIGVETYVGRHGMVASL